MKTFILNPVLLIHLAVAPFSLAVAPFSLAEPASEFWQGFSQTSEQTVYSETYLPCSEITAETPGSIQKSAQSRVQYEQRDGAPDTSHQHQCQDYDFVIDHHKCDWIIRSSEPDP